MQSSDYENAATKDSQIWYLSIINARQFFIVTKQLQ